MSVVSKDRFAQAAEDTAAAERATQKEIEDNLYGYFHMAKAAVRHMRPGSAIVMTGSVTGLLGNKNLPD